MPARSPWIAVDGGEILCRAASRFDRFPKNRRCHRVCSSQDAASPPDRSVMASGGGPFCWYPCWYQQTQETRPEGRFRAQNVEATTGFEPVNRGFADLRVEPLHHVATCASLSGSRRKLAAPRGFEPRFTDPKSAVLPLDEGAAVRERRNGAEDGTRTRDPHLGKVMLYQLSHFRPKTIRPPMGGAESQDRTGDTAIFSRVLYQLSYLGPMANQPSAARRRVGGYHGPRRAINAGPLRGL
jgi:hypothetical protein